MSGSGGSKIKEALGGKEDATTVVQPPIQSVGTAIDPMVLQQLRAGGFGGMVPSAPAFSPTSIPILQNPAQVEAYLNRKTATAAPVPAASTGGKTTKRQSDSSKQSSSGLSRFFNDNLYSR